MRSNNNLLMDIYRLLISNKLLIIPVFLLLFVVCASVGFSAFPTDYRAGYNLTSVTGNNNTLTSYTGSCGFNLNQYNKLVWNRTGGCGSYLEVTGNQGISGVQTLSISTWIQFKDNTKITTNLINHVNAASGLDASLDFRLIQSTPNYLLVQQQGGTGGATASLTYYPNNTDLNDWNNYIIIRNNTGSNCILSLYINNNLVNTTSSGAACTGSGTLYDAFDLGNSALFGATPTSNFSMSSTYLYGYLLTPQNINEIYTNRYNTTYALYSPLSIINLTLTAKDIYTNNALTNFSATIDGYQYNTTIGTITLPYLSNATRLFNVTYSSTQNGGYFNITELNLNLSSGTDEGLLWQSELYPNTLSEIMTNTNLTNSGGTITLGTQTINNSAGQFFKLSANNYSARVLLNGYYPMNTSLISVPALSNYTFNISGFYNQSVNVTAKYALNSSTINVFNVSLYNQALGYYNNYNTSTGIILIPSLANYNYVIALNSSIIMSSPVSFISAYNQSNVSLLGYSAISFNLQFVDEINSSPMSGVYFEVLGSVYSASLVATNSTYSLISLPATDYQIRYGINSTVLRPRSYVFRIPLTTTDQANITLKTLTQNSSALFDYVFQDNNAKPLTNSFMELQRFYTSSTSWQEVERSLLDSQGNAVFSGVPNIQYYRYVIYQNFSVIAISNPFYLISTTQVVPVSTTLPLLTTFSNYRNLQTSGLTLTNSSYLTFTYNDPSLTLSQICLNLTLVQNVNTSYASSCSNSLSGTLTLYINQNISGFYSANVFALYSGTDTFIVDSWSLRTSALNGGSILGRVSLFIVLLTVAVFGTLSFIQPEVGIVCICLCFIGYGLSFLGFTGVSIIANTTLLVIGGLVIWLLERN